MRRRAASCCCAGNPCDQLNLQCFGNVIPPKYVRIDGIQSLYALNNTLCAQPGTGLRCRCCTAPDETITHSLLFHAEGQRVYFNNGVSSGYRYELAGTWSFDRISTRKCVDPTYPPPLPLCPIEEIFYRQRYTEVGTFAGYLQCGPLACPNEDGSVTYYVGYAIYGTVSYGWEAQTYLHPCGDPPGVNVERLTERGTASRELQLPFSASNICSFKSICGTNSDYQFRNITFKQPECSNGVYSGFYPMEYRYTGSIAAVFARA